MKKIISKIIALIMFLVPSANLPRVNVETSAFKTNYSYIFVHGFSGWGEYNAINGVYPYWGVKNGDITKYLSARGFDCHAASVSPTASAWDRACELYAQLTGTVTDYGEVHSKNCNHERYGKDYSQKPLIEKWDAESKVNLVGHSFGGATVRMLAELMANGNEDEVKNGNNVSELFKGGKESWIYSIITVASPHNGTSSYNIQEDLSDDSTATTQEKLIAKVFLGISDLTSGGKKESDTAIYEMQIDNAMKINKEISTLKNIYYFSFACDSTYLDEKGVRQVDESVLTSKMYITTAKRICSYKGVTPEGYVIDEKWQANDGLVNTYSEIAPLGAPSVDFDKSNVVPGVWNKMPIHKGDHTLYQGEMKDYFNARTFYVDFFSMINAL